MGDNARCQEDPVSSPSRGLEETTRTPTHHMAEHHTAGSGFWEPIILHCLKQRMWHRTGLCGGCGRCTALHDLELHARSDDDEDLLKWAALSQCLRWWVQIPLLFVWESLVVSGRDSSWNCSPMHWKISIYKWATVNNAFFNAHMDETKRPHNIYYESRLIVGRIAMHKSGLTESGGSFHLKWANLRKSLRVTIFNLHETVPGCCTECIM